MLALKAGVRGRMAVMDGVVPGPLVRTASAGRESVSRESARRGTRSVGRGPTAACAGGFLILTLWSATQLLGHESGTWRTVGPSGGMASFWRELAANRVLAPPAASRPVICIRRRFHWRPDCPLIRYRSARRSAGDATTLTRAEADARHLIPCAYCRRLDLAAQLRIEP